MHSLIVFPFYFFTALSLTALLVIGARLLRSKVAINTLVVISVLVSLVAVISLLASDALSVDDLKLVPMLVLMLVSFVLAGIDAILMKSIPLDLDEEMVTGH